MLTDVKNIDDLKRRFNRPSDKSSFPRFTPMSGLLINSDLSKQDRELFIWLFNNIARRCYIITTIKDIEQVVGKNNASKSIKELEYRWLIRVVSKNMEKTGDRLIEINPNYVFRGHETIRNYHVNLWEEYVIEYNNPLSNV